MTPDAVAGIVEVKSNIHSRTGLREALTSLADDAALIRAARPDGEDLFVGLFAYQTALGSAKFEVVLQDLQNTATGDPDRIVSFVCLGCSHFEMFWRQQPGAAGCAPYNAWHAYKLPDLAVGYFISNLVAAVSGELVERYLEMWFPTPSKELQILGSEPFRKTS